MVLAEYGIFSQTFHLLMRFFNFINGITVRWDYVPWRIFILLVWIGIWTKLRIYRVTLNTVKWSYQGFGYMW